LKTIAIIPARGGSKRLINKNTMLLAGTPLLAHSILFAKKHAFIDEVYVTSNDEKIKEIALLYGAKVTNRPENLSGDFEPTVSALKHVLQNIENIENIENVVLLQPTNPLRPENLLVEAFKIYQNQKLDSLFTVSRNHQKFGKITDNKFLPYNYEIGQRSQDLEPLFFENGLLYISKTNLVFNDKIISENAFPLEVNHIFANVDIDTKADFDYAEFLIKNHNYDI
jgi:CMP-N-acetylneuraminic acid synthetase